MPLSLKCVANGRARYVVARREFSVDDAGWLAVNENQPYSIEIESPTVVDTFIVWFPRGWAGEVWRSATTPAAQLLAAPEHPGDGIEFFERYTPNETAVAPLAASLRHAHDTTDRLEDAWLEERLRALLARLFDVQRNLRLAMARLPALRAATREELWRRLNHARDFIHACADRAPTLSETARHATLSPYHFQRAFRAAFGQTPHDWLSACRVERAKFLLARTELPVTEICFAVGYQSVGSFSTWFQRLTGLAPRAWRQAHGAHRAIRNIREVSTPSALLASSASS